MGAVLLFKCVRQCAGILLCLTDGHPGMLCERQQMEEWMTTHDAARCHLLQLLLLL
jgi:hypothetical protein